MIKHIWFNSGILINQYFNSKLAIGEQTIVSSTEYNPATSIRQGISFEEFILNNGMSHELIKNDTCDNIVNS